MSNCARCNKKLGLRKRDPRPDWQIQGKICKDCSKFVTANASYYEADYKEGYPNFADKLKGLLVIHDFDDKRRILFTTKENHKIEISVQSIQKFEIIDYTEESKRKKIATMGLKHKSTSKHLQITFVGDDDSISTIFHVKEVEDAKNSINLLIQRYQKESKNITPPQNMIDAVKNATGKNFADVESLGKLNDKYGKIKKITKYLEYDETVLYVTRQSRVKPGGSAITTQNTIFATDRRILIRNPTMLGMRHSVEDMPYESISSVKLQAGVFSSTIIFTSPGFGEINRVSRQSLQRSWGREEESAIDAIPKKDAEELVKIIRKQIAKGQKVEFTQVVNNNTVTQEEDPLTILKKRLAKGEISKVEYEDLKSVLE